MTRPGGAIDAGEWLAGRRPPAPAELGQQLAKIVGSRACDSLTDLSQSLLADAESLIRGLGNDRSAAMGLLLADALITYAVEAAAEDCSRLEAIARQAMLRVSRAV